MTGRTARRTATGLMAFTFVMLAVNGVFGSLDRPYVGYDPGDNLYYVVAFLGCLIYLVVGRLIVSRQPTNTVGWLLIAIPVVGSLALGNGSYATRALAVPGTSLPLGIWSAWLDRWLLVAALFIFVPIFLFYPDGHLPSPRWRWVAVLLFGSMGLTTLAFATTPGRMTGFMAHLEHLDVRNPLGVGSPGGIVQAVTAFAGAITFVASILACSAIVVRYRGARDEVRQQIRWLALVWVTFFALLVLDIVLSALTGGNATVENVMFALGFSVLTLGIPVACGVAILRYRLYDLDVVVRKAVVFGLLAAFIAVVYAVIVAGAGTVIGSRSNPVLSFAAAAVLAIAFQPVREQARKLADRLVYGRRATPYEVLSEFSGRVGEAYATDDVLVRMAEVLAGGTGAASATIWLQVSGTMRPAATWPPDAVQPITLPEEAIEVLHQGDRLGALSVVVPPSEPKTPARRKLVEDLAAQAGLVLRNVRLIEELRASRQRLVAAQDERARKLERDLHDGAQQQLVALAVKLRLAGRLVDQDPEQARASLDRLAGEVTDALESLRDLAHGIYPPLLADEGLVEAIGAQARRAAVPVEVAAEGMGRYPQEVESAVYFCVLEALNNVAKYAAATSATIRLEAHDDVLSFTIDDDGVGFDPDAVRGTGLQGMIDRIDAVGGTVEIASGPGRGTSIRGRLPIPPKSSA